MTNTDEISDISAYSDEQCVEVAELAIKQWTRWSEEEAVKNFAIGNKAVARGLLNEERSKLFDEANRRWAYRFFLNLIIEKGLPEEMNLIRGELVFNADCGSDGYAKIFIEITDKGKQLQAVCTREWN